MTTKNDGAPRETSEYHKKLELVLWAVFADLGVCGDPSKVHRRACEKCYQPILCGLAHAARNAMSEERKAEVTKEYVKIAKQWQEKRLTRELAKFCASREKD
jgi:hypothetical protein